jgi:hypothetical protein
MPNAKTGTQPGWGQGFMLFKALIFKGFSFVACGVY